MKYYHGYWPVLAIIKQYLSNIKKRLARDLKAEHDDPALPGSNESQNMTPKVDGDEFEEGDEDEVKVDSDDDDETDLEDDKAEMEIYEDFGGALDHNSKQDDDDERHKSNDGGNPPVEQSVGYRLFLIYLSLTWTLFIANRNPFVNINL
jgi:hypothetical protein